MAYERGSGGAGGKSGNESFKKTFAEYTAHYNNKNGFQNKQLDDPYFNSSKPAGSTTRGTPSRGRQSPNPRPSQLGGGRSPLGGVGNMSSLVKRMNEVSRQINPEPDDPYFSNRSSPGSKIKSTSGPNGKGYNAVPYDAWKSHLPPTLNSALAPPIPGTAPDTPNLVRQHIETSPRLSQTVKDSLPRTWSDYTRGKGGGGWYDIPSQTLYSNAPFDKQIAEHEAIHANQFRGISDWDAYNRGTPYGTSESYRTIRDDLWQLAGQGNTGAQSFFRDVLPVYQANPSFQHNPEMYPYEIQAFVADGGLMPANEFPQWFKDRHLSSILTRETLDKPITSSSKYPVRWR